MDDETLRLVLELQQDDLRELQQIGNVEPSDDQLALNLYREELVSLATVISDRAVSRRIIEEEAGEAEDEEPAGEAVVPIDESVLPVDGAVTQACQPAIIAECVICLDLHDPRELYESHGCQHMYCSNCLRDLFERSINDEALFPPRCCGHNIPIDDMSDNTFFDQFEKTFRAKLVEYSTVDRTYCHILTCAAFIPPATIHGDIGICPECQARVCALCKGLEHQDHACTKDPATQEVLQLATENNWKRCPSCQAVVELGVGCYHITCRCKDQFCYLCLAKWKSCECPAWNEARLINPGEGRVARDAQAHNIAPEQRPVAVQLNRCNHLFWRSIDLDGNTADQSVCGTCREEMPLFIYQCDGCLIMACRRCRYNRFR
ncbi:ATP-dependent RNA helicase DEAH12, chloroplastic [Colletotrichum spaethianum]|uniref:RBR-type E3 ubiquitin transferase n=1 Tax=Colletotrichum spaethianum TaxID=700344 RepID=A0AA37LJR4_9PEZI|nr:ATP-dependent RNA helicase DEAH12, chloroplastic [Colletotrichum spaethianum]GKT47380.1 ATP-dependent RNA helicase DEAH12, chloroplastic [Colletotrichum spaethianum]